MSGIESSWPQDEASFKSCFGKAMLAENCQTAQFGERKNLVKEFVARIVQEEGQSRRSIVATRKSVGELDAVTKNKNCRCDDGNSTRNMSFMKKLGAFNEVPIQNKKLQSQVETLQWQLKQSESSREMYRQVMKQVVVFLEKAYRTLDILGTQFDPNDNTFRLQNDNTFTDGAINDFSSDKKTPEKQSLSEVYPEKLSQEAFRLLRTAQSLLSTKEPDLAQIGCNAVEDDLNFLQQLAKEFPQTNTPPINRTPSFSLNPKLLQSERETAFNRKLSLPLNGNELRRKDFPKGNFLARNDSFNREYRSSGSSGKSSSSLNSQRVERKSASPTVGSIGDGESGFSSMNSTQDVGLPISENCRSFLPIDTCENGGSSPVVVGRGCRNGFLDDVRLEVSSGATPFHKRRNSTPIATSNREKTVMKVLWV